MRPLRMSCNGTPPHEESMRVISCSAGISMEKISTEPFTFGSSATFSAMLSENAVLPMDGRPATMMRSPGCRPEVFWSRS